MLKSHKFRKWFLRSGHISLPDSDLGACEGKVGGCWCNERVSQYLAGKCPPLSPFGNIYVMAGSVVQCSHDTVRGTGGAGGMEGDNCSNSSKLLSSVGHCSVLLWELQRWQVVQLEN